jgi:hypothetical protein
MDNDELHRLELLSYDEKTENWFLDTRDARRLLLTRQTLDGLVQLYNSIHRGSPLTLADQRELRRLQDSNHRLSETIRDLYLHLDREQQRRWPRRVLQALSRFSSSARSLFRRPRR